MWSRALLTIIIAAATTPVVDSDPPRLPMTLAVCGELSGAIQFDADGGVMDRRGGTPRHGRLTSDGRRRLEEHLASEPFISGLSSLESEPPGTVTCAGQPRLRVLYGGQRSVPVVLLIKDAWVPQAIRDFIALVDEEARASLGSEYVPIGASLGPPEKVEGDPCPDPTIWRFRPFVGELVAVLSVDTLQMDLASVVESVTLGTGERSGPSEPSFDWPVGRRVIRLGGVASCPTGATCRSFEEQMRHWLRGKRLHVGIAPHLWAREGSEPPPAIVRESIDDPESINEEVVRRGWARFREEEPCAIGPFFDRRLRMAVKPCRLPSADCLARFSMEPKGPEMSVVDPDYLALVARGLSVVPELADQLEDSTPTPQMVPLFGGTWAVGDVAMAAISDIIRDVPWLEFVTGRPDPDNVPIVQSCGFCAYWDYVRATPANRRTLRGEFARWYKQHRDELVWKSVPALPTLGYFEVGTSRGSAPDSPH